MKKTKIIATYGPVCENEEVLENMIKKGMDILRVNMSYSTKEDLEKIKKQLDKINKKLNTNTSIMVDTDGANIHVGKLEGKKAILKQEDKIRIYEGTGVGNSTKFFVDYEYLLEEIRIHTILKINDGLVSLEVIEKGHDYLLCEVKEEGMIEEGKKITVIGSKLSMPFLTEEDRESILYASKLNIDYLALSFVCTHEDVLEVNDLLIEAKDSHMFVLSKIESKHALDDLDEIIKASDGIIVARGDLGVEIPLENVPIIQKQIVEKCHEYSKVSVVATEMLASMEENIRPTRAEVSDIANAVLDGVDAVMLTGETTIGRHPKETIETMARVLEAAEANIDHKTFVSKTNFDTEEDVTGAIAYSTIECANRLKANIIVAPTISGYTAKKLSRFHHKAPILALSPDMDTVKSLNIYFGVIPSYVKHVKEFDAIIDLAKEEALKYKEKEKEKIIITGGYPFKQAKNTNFMKIEEI